MNYSDLLQLLDQASAFDIYRLRTVLDNMMDDPQRLNEVKVRLRLGMSVSYYEPSLNRIEQGVVERIKQTRVLIRNADGRRWDVPLCAINIHDVEITHHTNPKQTLTRNDVSIGDRVGFRDRTGKDHQGMVKRLNQKTVTIDTEIGSWRVAYSFLYKVIEHEGEGESAVNRAMRVLEDRNV